MQTALEMPVPYAFLQQNVDLSEGEPDEAFSPAGRVSQGDSFVRYTNLSPPRRTVSARPQTATVRPGVHRPRSIPTRDSLPTPRRSPPQATIPAIPPSPSTTGHSGRRCSRRSTSGDTSRQSRAITARRPLSSRSARTSPRLTPSPTGTGQNSRPGAGLIYRGPTADNAVLVAGI